MPHGINFSPAASPCSVRGSGAAKGEGGPGALDNKEGARPDCVAAGRLSALGGACLEEGGMCGFKGKERMAFPGRRRRNLSERGRSRTSRAGKEGAACVESPNGARPQGGGKSLPPLAGRAGKEGAACVESPNGARPQGGGKSLPPLAGRAGKEGAVCAQSPWGRARRAGGSARRLRRLICRRSWRCPG